MDGRTGRGKEDDERITKHKPNLSTVISLDALMLKNIHYPKTIQRTLNYPLHRAIL